jgi:transposase
MARFECRKAGVQAFQFTLDPTEEQARLLARHFGARCKVSKTAKPSLRALRKRWNMVKDDVCVNAETGASRRLRLNLLSDNAFHTAATSHGILQKYVANFLEFAHTFE